MSQLGIQYASDLHLEFYESDCADFYTFVKPVKPILVLAGDIGRPQDEITRKFIAWCSAHWKHVIWIFGNHEYYAEKAQNRWKFCPNLPTMAETEAAARGQFSNVHVLQAETLELEGVLFFGATMWTVVPPALHARIGNRINDYNCILEDRDTSGNPIAFRNSTRTKLYRQHRKALEDTIKMAKITKKPLIVVTHHLPTVVLTPPKFAGSPLNPYYSSDMWGLLKGGGITAWICGHSHGRSILEMPTLCVLNARGYPGEQGTDNPYTTTAVLTIRAPRPLAETEDVEFI